MMKEEKRQTRRQHWHLAHLNSTLLLCPADALGSPLLQSLQPPTHLVTATPNPFSCYLQCTSCEAYLRMVFRTVTYLTRHLMLQSVRCLKLQSNLHVIFSCIIPHIYNFDVPHMFMLQYALYVEYCGACHKLHRTWMLKLSAYLV